MQCILTCAMTKRNTTRLIKAYSKYRTKRNKNVLGFFRTQMAEILYRTTKLEGEPITRRMIAALFSAKGRSTSG